MTRSPRSYEKKKKEREKIDTETYMGLNLRFKKLYRPLLDRAPYPRFIHIIVDSRIVPNIANKHSM